MVQPAGRLGVLPPLDVAAEHLPGRLAQFRQRGLLDAVSAHPAGSSPAAVSHPAASARCRAGPAVSAFHVFTRGLDQPQRARRGRPVTRIFARAVSNSASVPSITLLW